MTEPTTLKLYEMAPAFARLMATIWEADPGDPGAIELAGTELEALQLAIDTKVAGCAAIVREFETTRVAITMEAERLAARAAALKAKEDRLREYMHRALLAAGLTRVETARFTVSVRQNPEAVEIVQQADVPAEYIRTRITQEVDKTAIKRHHAATGEDVPGVRFTRGTRLEIR